MHRSLLSSALVLSMLVAGVAHAQTKLNVQARWEPVNLTGMVASLFGDTGFGVGAEFDQFVVRGSLAVQRVSMHGSYDSADFNSSSTVSGTLVTPGLSAQYYFTPPESGFVPYATLGLAKAFALTSTESCDDSDCTSEDSAQMKYERSLLSPWILHAGAGIEYFTSSNVSIGTEMGLRFIYSSASETDSGETQSESISAFSLLYGVVTLNFHW